MIDLLKCYRDMLLIRKFEEKAGQLYVQGLIGGFCHLYIGQEAIAVGIGAMRSKLDSIITSYRDHGFILALGSKPDSVMAELMGKETGSSKGKGGSMHIFDLDNKFYGGHGIVGAQVPIGAGLAFADSYNKEKGVTFSCLGDGAINQGQVYETFNMAALWKLPIIFIVENNEYGMGTSVARASANADLWKRGESCGIEGIRVDGMDVLEVIRSCKEAAEGCRDGKGPIILEMQTYRYRGHSVSDPAKYRDKSDVQKIRDERDPINMLGKHLMEEGNADQDVLDEIAKSIKKEIDSAIEFAKRSKEPDALELYSDVLE